MSSHRIRISCVLENEDTRETASGKMLLLIERDHAVIYIQNHDDPKAVHVVTSCGGSCGLPQQVLSCLGLPLPPQALTG